MKKFRRLIAVICALCLITGCLAGCSSSAPEAAVSTAAPAAENNVVVGHGNVIHETERPQLASYNTGVITGMSLDERGRLSITRDPAKAEPMGEKNSWTIFVYLCGSNLESNWGLATDDLQEMIDGSKNSRVRYVVLTGGSTEWQNDLVDPSVLEIYLVENGAISFVTAADYNYMNDPETLSAFLIWGIENYSADKMGLVLWDHGGGSIGGVCVDYIFFDDLNNDRIEDSSKYTSTLTLPGIASALSQVYDEMTDQFEFIGFDACLMGTLETAFMLSPYARYMFASQESEPGNGWDYTAIGDAIGRSGKIDGARLGRVVCDSFYDSCAATDDEEQATLSCINLSVIDDLVLAFDTYARGMMEAAETPSSLAAIAQSMTRAEFFGGNSEEEGYYNLVDLADVVNDMSASVPGAKTVLNAIGQVVSYNKNGIFHENACGLSVYYPLHIESGSGELGYFAEVVVSPYYYGYVAQNYYAAANGGLDGYDPAVSMDAWASAMDADVENIIEDYGENHITGASPYVMFVKEPQFDEGGAYGFTLAQESIPYISSVEADIYFFSDDGEDLVYLGSTTDVLADWETGEFVDNFDGLWFCLPDGQMISTTVISETDEFSVYTTPVLLNGEETNLRFSVKNSDYTVTLYGVWSGIDEYGMAGKNTYQLKAGDIIQPLFRAVNIESQEVYMYHGVEYVYEEGAEWCYNNLFDSDYLYQFCIYDIYGDNYTTDGVMFSVVDGVVYFTEEE